MTYTPNAGFSGTDSFTFKVNDGVVDGNTTTVSITVNAPPPPSGGMHVGDLDGSSTNEGKTWTATVVVTAHDANHGALSNSTLWGHWNSDPPKSVSCQTNSTGT